MPSPYWKVMNDLSETITSFLTVRDVLRDAGDNPDMNKAALTLLEHYIENQDQVFTKAWNEVIRGNDTMPPWGHSDMEALKYSDEELAAMCDRAELDEANLQQSKEQIYKNYRAAIDEYNKLNEKYKELTACHMELQDLFYRVDGELDEYKAKYDNCQSNYRIVVTKLKEVSEERLELERQLDDVKEYDC